MASCVVMGRASTGGGTPSRKVRLINLPEMAAGRKGMPV